MNKRFFQAVVLLCGFCLSGLVFAGETVKIGILAPVTGPWASEGQDMLNVIETIATRINNSGGVNGRRLSLEVGDDGGDPRTAALAAQRLATSGAVAVVGTYGSAITEAAQGIFDDEGILQIATGSTSIRLSEKGMPLFFRTCPRDDDQGRVLSSKVLGMGMKKFAILHDNSAYAKGLAEECKGHLEAAKAEIVFYDAITAGDQDFTTSLASMKTAAPDMIIFTGYYPEAAMLLRQKQDMGWNVPMIGGDATNNTALIEISGTRAAEGFMFISPPGPQDLTDVIGKQFMDDFKRYYGSMPTSVWSIMAGDAFMVLVEALRHVDEVTSSNIGRYLHNSLRDFPGFTGAISFNAKGDRMGDVYRLYKVDASGVSRLVPN